MPYYCVIGGWVIKYFVTYFTGHGVDAAYVDEQKNTYFDLFITQEIAPIIFFVIFLGACAFIVFRGVNKGIESSSKIIMPILFVLVIGISIFSLTLEHTDAATGVTRTGLEGLKVYVIPNLDGLTLGGFFRVLIDAMNQLFFSISVAMGIMVTYGSYVKDEDNLAKSINRIEFFDTFVAVLAGMMIVPAVYTFMGTEGMNKGPGLMFVSLPKIFEVMDMVAAELDSELVLGVDKDLKARFLLPLMEKCAAGGFVNASLAVDLTRGTKDMDEQQKMRVASDLNDQAMAQFKSLIHEGVSEKEVAEKMLKVYLDLGADGFSFEPIVSFGANAADPHHMPDDTILKEGDCVLFDVGCIKDGYCSDMTRTFYYKYVSDECRKIYDTVRAANEAAEAIIKPGVALCDLDGAARKLITDEGYGPYFTHRLGHFIGLDEHEFGDVSAVSTWVARPGMIFSVEPGIYLAGNTGVRIEDLVLVTEDGCEVLNRYSKEIEIIE